MSLGVGLLTFASLETIGIYFGLGKCPVGKLHRPPGSWGEGWWLAITLAKSHDLNFFFFKSIPYVCVFFLTACEVSERSLAEPYGKKGGSPTKTV